MAWKKRNTSGPRAAPPVVPLRRFESPSLSFSGRKSSQSARK